MNNNELFTLEALGEFYTAAAKAGGMEVLSNGYWHKTLGGPNPLSRVAKYRAKQAPVVLYAIRLPHNYINTNDLFQSEEAAHQWNNSSITQDGEVIKLIEEVKWNKQTSISR